VSGLQSSEQSAHLQRHQGGALQGLTRTWIMKGGGTELKRGGRGGRLREQVCWLARMIVRGTGIVMQTGSLVVRVAVCMCAQEVYVCNLSV
jgi:hypothetical protein